MTDTTHAFVKHLEHCDNSQLTMDILYRSRGGVSKECDPYVLPVERMRMVGRCLSLKVIGLKIFGLIIESPRGVVFGIWNTKRRGRSVMNHHAGEVPNHLDIELDYVLSLEVD